MAAGLFVVSGALHRQGGVSKPVVPLIGGWVGGFEVALGLQETLRLQPWVGVKKSNESQAHTQIEEHPPKQSNARIHRSNKRDLLNVGALCLDVRTLTCCQLMGFPSNHQKLNFRQGSR